MDNYDFNTDTFWDSFKAGHFTSCLELLAGSDICELIPFWRYLKAELLRKAGRFAEAESELLAVYDQMEDKRYRVEMSLGELYEETGRFEKAELWFRKATVSAPSNDATVWMYLSHFLISCERFDEAKSALLRVSSFDNLADEAALFLGKCERCLGNLEEARRWFLRALELCPTYPAATTSLDDIDSALEVRRKRLAAEPGNEADSLAADA